MRRKSGLCR